MLKSFGFETEDLMVVGGSGALTYLAMSKARTDKSGKPTMRISLTKDGSLLTDVRFLGAVGLGYMAAKGGKNKDVMRQGAMACAMSLANTEAMRLRFMRDPDWAGQFPKDTIGGKLLPDFGSSKETASGMPAYGAAPRQAAWARG